MELLKRSMVLAAVLAAGMGLAACQTDGEVGASGSVDTPAGGASGGASGEIDAPASREPDSESSR